MSKFFSLIKINTSKLTLKNKKNFKVGCNYPLMTGILMLLTLFFAVVYVIKINQSLAYGLKLSDLEKDVVALAKENKNYEATILKLQSVQKIKAESQKLKMVQVNEVDYLNQGGNGVALNK